MPQSKHNLELRLIPFRRLSRKGAIILERPKNSGGLALRADRARLDTNAKRVLGLKVFQAPLLKGLLPEFSNLPLSVIMQDYLDNTDVPGSKEAAGLTLLGTESLADQTEAKMHYDLVFSVKNPDYHPDLKSSGLSLNSPTIRLDEEIQNSVHAADSLPERMVVYLANLVSRQRDEFNTEFHYENLQKVVCVWILPRPPLALRNTLVPLTLQSPVQPDGSFYELDHMRLFVIGLGDWQQTDVPSVVRMLDVVFSDKLNTEEKIRILESQFGLTLTEKDRKELFTMNGYADAVYEDGKDEGINIGRVQSVLNLMDTSGMNMKEAMEALKISPADEPRYQLMIQEMSRS